jgi:uncharacterized membrane protein HdeD (DUF308 family)
MQVTDFVPDAFVPPIFSTQGEIIMTTSEAIAMNTKRRPWWLTLVLGIMAMVVGGILLWAPTKTKIETYQLLVAILGIYWIVDGIMNLVSMFVDHTMWGWKLFIGIVSLLAGWYILAYPTAAGVALPRIMVLVLGLWGIFEGIALIVMAFAGAGWGAGILGVLWLILGGILLADYGDFGSGLAMVWAGAVVGLIGGAILIWQAFRDRRE